jgi:hypothetical protein
MVCELCGFMASVSDTSCPRCAGFLCFVCGKRISPFEIEAHIDNHENDQDDEIVNVRAVANEVGINSQDLEDLRKMEEVDDDDCEFFDCKKADGDSLEWEIVAENQGNEKQIKEIEIDKMRKKLALEKVEEIRKKHREQKRLEKIQTNQIRFGEVLAVILSGQGVSEEQLEILWDVSKDLTAEQASAVLVQQLEIRMSSPIPIPATTTDSGGGGGGGGSCQEDENTRRMFCLAVDAVLGGKGVTSQQISTISDISTRLSTDVLVSLLSDRLTIHWKRKEDAKKVSHVNCDFM